jgi:hypothetical protein
VGRDEDPHSQEEAAFWRNAALEAMDRLREHVDLIGMNFYPDSQVECYWDARARRYRRRMLPLDDSRRISLTQALSLYRERYGPRPIIVAETSVRGARRLPWLRYMTDQAVLALRAGLPLAGLCWYPVLDVPDWGGLVAGRTPRTLEDLRLAHSGLIRLERTGGALRRVLSAAVAREVRLQEARLQQTACASVEVRLAPLGVPSSGVGLGWAGGEGPASPGPLDGGPLR